MIIAIIAVVGALVGLISHDVAVQSLGERPLRPLVGICHVCGVERGWQRRRCKNGHSATRGWLVAVIVAIFGILFANAVGVGILLIPYGTFLGLTTALMLTDVDAMRIVDRINIPGSAIAIGLLALGALVEGMGADLLRSLAGGGVYFVGALAVFLIARGKGFGAGDVKLAPVLGVFTTFLGWVILGRAVFATAMIGGVLAFVALLFMSAKRDTELPYGPAMVLGSWAAITLVGVGTLPIWS